MIRKRSLLHGLVLLLSVGCAAGCLRDFAKPGLLEAGTAGLVTAPTSYPFALLPSSFTINVPSTLSPSALSTQAFQAQSPLTISEDAVGYSQLVDLVSEMRTEGTFARLELMMVDAAFSQGESVFKGAPGTCFDGGQYNITFTLAMRETLAAAIRGLGAGNEADIQAFIAELETSGIFPKVGDTILGPAMVYNQNQSGYDNEIRYAYALDATTGELDFDVAQTCAAAGSPIRQNIMRWNNDKQKFQFGYRDSEDFGGLTVVFTGLLSLNFTKRTMTFKNNFTDGTFTYNQIVSLQECGANDCVKLNMNDSFDDGFDQDQYVITGRTDDLGGFVSTKYVPPAPGPTEYYREYFDAAGTLLGLQESTDGVNYTAVTGYESFDYSGDTYDDEPTTLDLPSVSISALSCTDCSFVIVPNGIDPTSDPDAVIGGGEENGGIEVYFWGEESEVSGADVYQISSYDGSGNPVFLLSCSDCVTLN